MPCSDSMIPASKVVSVTKDQTVGQTIELLETKRLRTVPVLDQDGKLVGIYGVRHFLRSLLPLASSDEDDEEDELGELHRLHSMDISLDFLTDSAPWLIRRMESIWNLPVSETMQDDPSFVFPDTPLREAIRKKVKHGSPLCVVEDEKTMKLAGIITGQSVLTCLHKLQGTTQQSA